jgi:calcineurin-like phosphoesterase family protein
MRFWTSDWHVSHRNIIEFTNRPFWRLEVPMLSEFGEVEPIEVPDVDAMNRALIGNTNDMVGPDDELWMVGDLAMGHFVESIELFRQLRCRNLFMVAGNHDRNHKMHDNWRKWEPFYEEVGFTVLDQETRTTVGDTEVLVCHFPYWDVGRHASKYSAQLPYDDGVTPLIHGHTHNAERYDLERRMIHVGVDAWNMAPVPETEIERIIGLIQAEA